MNRMFTSILMSERHSLLHKLVHLVRPLHDHAVSLLHHDDVTPQKRKQTTDVMVIK